MKLSEVLPEDRQSAMRFLDIAGRQCRPGGKTGRLASLSGSLGVFFTTPRPGFLKQMSCRYWYS
jgi:hypothetical protein